MMMLDIIKKYHRFLPSRKTCLQPTMLLFFMEARIRTSFNAFSIYLSDRLASFTFFNAQICLSDSRITLYTVEYAPYPKWWHKYPVCIQFGNLSKTYFYYLSNQYIYNLSNSPFLPSITGTFFSPDPSHLRQKYQNSLNNIRVYKIGKSGHI